MTDRTKIIHRWRDRCLGITDKPNYGRGPLVTGYWGDSLHAHRVWADDRNRLYSYGTHFELARMIYDGRGKPMLWLLNGEQSTTNTTKHQAEVRAALSGTDIPIVILPYDVLGEAGIVFDSIRLLDVQKDWSVTTEIVKTEFPKSAVWKYDAPALLPGTGGYLCADGRTRQWWEFDSYDDRKDLPEIPVVRKQTGRRMLHLNERSHDTWELFDLDGQVAYRRSTVRHYLGASLITAQVAGRTSRHRFLSGFDENETRPSYFFCELPRTSKAVSVTDAYDDLKPSAVRQAEQMGRDVKRQGDIFAIPMPSLDRRTLTRQGAVYQKGGSLLGTNHVATETATLPGGLLLARGTLRHDPFGRRPDHKRVPLGNQWHAVLKNTVPVTA